MENIKISYQDIAYRNGSETLFMWYNGKNVTNWEAKDGILLAWSVMSAYDESSKHHIIPVGLVQMNVDQQIRIVPSNRISIKNQ